jgi:hypothetical protein
MSAVKIKLSYPLINFGSETCIGEWSTFDLDLYSRIFGKLGDAHPLFASTKILLNYALMARAYPSRRKVFV